MFDIFSKKKTKDENSTMTWHPIEEMEQIDSMIEASHSKPVVIFKHSTRCGVSNMALSMFVSDLKNPEDYDLHILDVLSFRDVSTAIANKFEIFHQSPQLIVLKDGKVVLHNSHHGIKASDLETI